MALTPTSLPAPIKTRRRSYNCDHRTSITSSLDFKESPNRSGVKNTRSAWQRRHQIPSQSSVTVPLCLLFRFLFRLTCIMQHRSLVRTASMCSLPLSRIGCEIRFLLQCIFSIICRLQVGVLWCCSSESRTLFRLPSLSLSPPLPFLPAAFSLVRSLLNCVFFHRTREGLARRSVTACDFKQRPFRFLWEKEKNKFLRSRCRRQPDSRRGAGTWRCGFVAQVSRLDCFQMECGDFLDRGLSWKSFRRLFCDSPLRQMTLGWKKLTQLCSFGAIIPHSITWCCFYSL